MATLPRTSLDVFPVNLGTNTFGWTSDREASFAVLDAFAEAGGNFIDTADLYSVWVEGNDGGVSEEIIGEWMAARGNRDDIVVATKVGGLPTRPGLSRDNVIVALEDSLRRLQTDHVDLYYFHYDDEDVAIADQVRTAHELVVSGKVRHVALSNHSPERMREFFATATREGLTVPVAIQPQYSLLHRADVENGYGAIAREFDAALLPYFSLASGLLTGKYTSAADIETVARKDMLSGYLGEATFDVVGTLVEIAEARGVEPTTVALAWLLAKGVTAPIASASRPDQLPAIMAAPALELSADEVSRLDAVSAPTARAA